MDTCQNINKKDQLLQDYNLRYNFLCIYTRKVTYTFNNSFCKSIMIKKYKYNKMEYSILLSKYIER